MIRALVSTVSASSTMTISGCSITRFSTILPSLAGGGAVLAGTVELKTYTFLYVYNTCESDLKKIHLGGGLSMMLKK